MTMPESPDLPPRAPRPPSTGLLVALSFVLGSAVVIAFVEFGVTVVQASRSPAAQQASLPLAVGVAAILTLAMLAAGGVAWLRPARRRSEAEDQAAAPGDQVALRRRTSDWQRPETRAAPRRERRGA